MGVSLPKCLGRAGPVNEILQPFIFSNLTAMFICLSKEAHRSNRYLHSENCLSKHHFGKRLLFRVYAYIFTLVCMCDLNNK